MSRNYELLTQGELKPLLAQPPANPGPIDLTPSPVSSIPSETATGEETNLAQRILLMAGSTGLKTVVVCGVSDGSTSPMVAARVGEILAADSSRKICLVDADVHAPSIHSRYRIENHTGLSEAAVDSRPFGEFACRVGESNLWLVPGGQRTRERRTVWPIDRLREGWLSLRQQFDLVLTNAPAIDRYPDAIVFGRISDGVVLVLKEGSTRRTAALKAKANLEVNDVRLLGVVLTHHAQSVAGLLDEVG